MAMTGTPSSFPADEPALMALGGRVVEVGDLFVVDEDGVFELLNKPAQARAKDDAHAGRFAVTTADELGGFVDLIEKV